MRPRFDAQSGAPIRLTERPSVGAVASSAPDESSDPSLLEGLDDLASAFAAREGFSNKATDHFVTDGLLLLIFGAVACIILFAVFGAFD